MSKKDKLLEKLKSKPKDFTYDELLKLLQGFGFELDEKGKTSGSRVVFYHKESFLIISLHKPHPGNELKQYQIKQVLETLKELGVM